MAKTYRFDPEEDLDDVPQCPVCGGPGVYLGNLGFRAYYRCRNCGSEFAVADQDALTPTEGGAL